MNNNHPKQKILDLFASGDLDDQISVITSTHLRSCAQCQKYIATKEKDFSEIFDKASVQPQSSIPDFSEMKNFILKKPSHDDQKSVSKKAKRVSLQFNNKTIELPPTLLSAKENMSPWKSIGNISYSKVDIHGSGNMYFVHFEPGVNISEHTHDGNEYAYVIAGSFRDQHSEYITGDFASFSHDDSHNPYTEDPDGCLLLVSIDGPFIFKEGLARLLNPFRRLFYKKL